MPPPGTGYDLAESVYMENLLKGQRNKEQQKLQAEEDELAKYRMASSTVSSKSSAPKLALVAPSAKESSSAIPLVKIKLKRKSSTDSGSSAVAGDDTKKEKKAHKKHKKSKEKEHAKPTKTATSEDAGGLSGLTAYSSGDDDDDNEKS
eukprot:8930-Heterococcus_DN1.PRE.3